MQIRKSTNQTYLLHVCFSVLAFNASSRPRHMLSLHRFYLKTSCQNVENISISLRKEFLFGTITNNMTLHINIINTYQVV